MTTIYDLTNEECLLSLLRIEEHLIDGDFSSVTFNSILMKQSLLREECLRRGLDYTVFINQNIII